MRTLHTGGTNNTADLCITIHQQVQLLTVGEIAADVEPAFLYTKEYRYIYRNINIMQIKSTELINALRDSRRIHYFRASLCVEFDCSSTCGFCYRFREHVVGLSINLSHYIGLRYNSVVNLIYPCHTVPCSNRCNE